MAVVFLTRSYRKAPLDDGVKCMIVKHIDLQDSNSNI